MGATAPLLHVLGGSTFQLSTVKLAQRLGYRVLVTDMYAERPAYAIADEHEVCDITDARATLEVARRHRIDGIVCDTTDVGVPTMAYVADELGLAGMGCETALDFTNKLRMRQRTSAAGVPNPPFALAPDPAAARVLGEDLGYPCVVKSVDSQGSRGVRIVGNGDEMAAGYEAARAVTRSDVLVEGFLPGREITVEGWCVDGEPHVACISDKDHFAGMPVAHRLTYPADVTPQQRDTLVQTNARVVRALGLRTGVTHAEYMLDGDNVSLIEIAARGGGSRVYTDIVPALANRDIPAAYLRFVMGEAWADPGSLVPPAEAPAAANLAFFRFPPGVVSSVDGVDEARALAGVADVVIELTVGEPVPPVDDDRSRNGFALVFGSSRDEVLARTAEVYERVAVTIDGVPRHGRP